MLAGADRRLLGSINEEQEDGHTTPLLHTELAWQLNLISALVMELFPSHPRATGQF